MLTFLESLHPWAAFGLFLLENVAIFGVAVALGSRLDGTLGILRVLVSPNEWRWAASTVGFNVLITQAGFLLWRTGWIRFSESESIAELLGHVIVLFFAMDLLMYFFHYAIHHLPTFKSLHALHHEYATPSVVDLFVLHPVEVLGFGGLWLGLLLLHPFHIGAVVMYLIINVLFGMAGHLRVERFPDWWRQSALTNWLATTAFHVGHHQNQHRNFGFYTLIWDRLFGTLER